MRRINWKFAAGLMLVSLLSIAGGWGLYVFQSGRISQSLLWLARKERDEGRPEAAIKFAGQYLRLQPDDAAVMIELSEWMRERASGRKQLAGVLHLYEKVLRIEARNDEIRRKAIDGYLVVGQYGEAFDHIDRLLQSQPNDAELLTQAGWCLQAAGKYEAAADHYRRAIQANPRYVGGYAYAAALQQSQFKKFDVAGDLYAQAVAANPDSAEARAGLAAFYRRQKKFDDAAREIQEGLKRHPENATLLLTASDIASAAGKMQLWREMLDRGFQAHPKDTRFACALSWQLLYDGRADLAVQKLRTAKSVNPNDIDILTLLGDILAQDGQIAPLEQALKELQDAKAGQDKIQPRVAYLEARLLMRRGRFADASKKLADLRTAAQRQPSLARQVNILIAQCADAIGDRAGEIDAFKRLLEQDPNAGSLRLEYARALARAGKHADALREFSSVVARPEVSSRIVSSAAGSLIRHARSDTAAWAEFQKAIDGLPLDENNANPTIARATLERERQRPDVALPIVLTAIGKQPRNATLHVLRAELLEQKFGADRATAALSEAEKIVGDVGEIRVMKARLLAERSDRSQSAALAAMSQDIESFTADDRQRIVREVVAGFRLIDDADQVTRMLRRLATVRPDDFTSREALHSIAIRKRDIVGQHALYAEIEALEGKDGPCLQRLDAQRMIWNGSPENLANAERNLAATVEHRPKDPAIPFLRGRIAELRGDGEAARVQYRLAFDRDFLNSPLEELLLDVPGESRSAPCAVLRDELLSRLSIDSPRSVVVAALPLLDPASRDRLADRLTAQCPPNHVAHQAWLGRLFTKMGLANRAEAAFRQVGPQSADGWLALLSERANDPAKFDAACTEVRQAMSPIEANLVIGRALEGARRFADAKRCYEDAVQMKPDDPRSLRALAVLAIQTGQSADACRTLEALSALPETSHAEDVRWARRNLALQLAFSPSLASFQKSMNLLDRNQLPEGSVVDDLRARALVLATQKGRPLADGKTTARREAIILLETLQDRARARSADDLVLLAKLYRAENDEAKFRSACDRMRTERSGHFGCVAFLAREALREFDAAGCEKLLPSLRQLGAGQFDTLTIEFQYLTLAGESERARKLLTDYVVASPSPAEQAQRERRLANFLHDFLAVAPMADRVTAAGELRSLAIRWFSNRMENDPEALQRLCVMMAQHGQAVQALDWLLHKARTTFSVEAVAAAQVMVLRNGSVGEASKQAIGRSLSEAVEKNPKSLALQVSLADFHQLAGQREQAIAGYRKVLAADPNNVVALNNLAWTMAADRRTATDAMMLVQRAIDLVGPLDDLLDTRARIRLESGDLEAALRDQTEAAGEVPTASRLVELAGMHRKAGQNDAADRVMQKARLYAHNAEAPAPR